MEPGPLRRLHLAFEARSAQAPLGLPDFTPSYRKMRVVVNLAIIACALTLGVAALDHRPVVIPALVALSSVIILHSRFAPATTSWEMMALIDSVAYMTMVVLIDLPSVIPLVVITQLLVGFLFVSLRTAMQMGIALVLLGWLATIVTEYVEYQLWSPAWAVLFNVVISLMALTQVFWVLIEAGGEIQRQRQAEQELSAEKDRLLAAKDRFVATVSHELRTPLTAVVGYADTLAQSGGDLDKAELLEFASIIARQSHEVAAIVEDLLVAARAETGGLSVQAIPVDLSDELREVAATLAVEVGDRDVTGVRVKADPIRTRQIVRNLLTNARRYGGDSINATTDTSGGFGVLAIKDNGPGLPDDFVDSAFDAYERVNHVPGKTDPIGLGLTVSRTLARLMGGDVTYAHHNGWTTFQLSLPILQPSQPDGDGRTFRLQAEAR